MLMKEALGTRKKTKLKKNSISLIEDLEISNIFKDKDNKEGNSVTDKLINEIL